MDSGSLAELRQCFEDQLQRTSAGVQFRDAMAARDPLFLTHCSNLKTELDCLEAMLKLMQEELPKQRQRALSYAQELKSAAKTLVDRVQYVEQNLPTHLPQMQKQDTIQNAQEAKQGSTWGAGKDSTGSTMSKTSASDVSESSNATTVRASMCPAIDYLTTEEFEAVPKYIKGRLQYQLVNKTIDDINKSFQAKYKMMALKKSKQNDIIRKRISNYKQQETKDTKGVYFVVEADLKEFSSIRMDRSMYALLTLLRHCGRMREVRGGCLTRYAIIEGY